MGSRGSDDVRRATRRLVVAQTAAFAASGVAVGLAPTALAHGAGHGRSAGAVLAVIGLASGVGAIVGGRLMDRGDRSAGLAAAHAVSGLAGLAAAAAALAGSVAGLLVAIAVAAAGQGAALLGRAVVARLHPPARRGRALGLMLTIGALGAAGGPVAVAGLRALAGAAGLEPAALPWLALPALGALGAAAVLSLGRDPSGLVPHDDAPRHAPAPSTAAISALAVGAFAAAQVAMVSMMAIAPASIHRHSGSEIVAALAIAGHLLGMYGLAVPIGRIVDRRGHPAGLAVGAALSAAGALTSSAPLPPAGAAMGLMILGAGWSAVYLTTTAAIGATRGARRTGALGATDLLAAAAGASAALGAGIAAEAVGQAMVGLAVAAPMAALAVALLAPATGSAAAPPAARP